MLKTQSKITLALVASILLCPFAAHSDVLPNEASILSVSAGGSMEIRVPTTIISGQIVDFNPWFWGSSCKLYAREFRPGPTRVTLAPGTSIKISAIKALGDQVELSFWDDRLTKLVCSTSMLLGPTTPENITIGAIRKSLTWAVWFNAWDRQSPVNPPSWVSEGEGYQKYIDETRASRQKTAASTPVSQPAI